MKKYFFLVSALIIASASSSAYADNIGLRGQYHKLLGSELNDTSSIGVQYQYNLDEDVTLRLAVDFFPNLYSSSSYTLPSGAKAVFNGARGVGLEGAYILNNLFSLNDEISVYAGGGVGFNTVSETIVVPTSTTTTATVNGSVTTIYAQAIMGLNYYMSPEVSLFSELAAGPLYGSSVINGTAGNKWGVALNARIGLTYNF